MPLASADVRGEENCWVSPESSRVRGYWFAFPHVLQLMIHNSLIDSLRYKISLAMGEEGVGGGGVELLSLRVIWRS